MVVDERLTKLLESLQRLGLHGLVGKQREKAAARSVAAYFRLLKMKMPVDRLAELAKAEHKQAAQHTAEITIQRVLRGVQPLLTETLIYHKLLAYKEGYKQTVVEEVREADRQGDVSKKAADYAAASAAEQVTGIDKTTIESLQDLIGEAIDDQLTVDQLAAELVAELEGFTLDRARMIARTEMSDAFAQSAIDKLNDFGVQYKQWISYAACCDDCAANDDDGPIPIDDYFSSGDDAPPAHPNCRCTIAGARNPDLSEATELKEYSDDEPRDELGRWTAGDGPGASDTVNNIIPKATTAEETKIEIAANKWRQAQLDSGMTDREIDTKLENEDFPERWVYMDRLKSNQETLSRTQVNFYRTMIKNGAEPSKDVLITKLGNQYYVSDGNHRMAAAKVEGKTRVRAKVWDLNI